MEDLQDFINRRKAIGLTQAELGKELGISPRQMWAIEKGEYPLRRVYVVALNWIEYTRQEKVKSAPTSVEATSLMHIPFDVLVVNQPFSKPKGDVITEFASEGWQLLNVEGLGKFVEYIFQRPRF